MECKNEKKKSNVFLNVLLVLFIIGIIGVGSYIGYHFWTLHKAQAKYEKIRVKDKRGLKKKYKNMVGWIKIKGSNIDYPVMDSPKGDPDFYLTHDMTSKYSPSGAIFKDPDSRFEDSYHSIIFGHHMSDGTMFGSLIKYQYQNYADSHRQMKFIKWYKDGSYNVQKYKVFGAYKCLTDDADNYMKYAEIKDKKTFDKYIKMVVNRTMIKSNIKPMFGDEMLTLSTCSHHVGDYKGRLVVVFVKDNIK